MDCRVRKMSEGIITKKIRFPVSGFRFLENWFIGGPCPPLDLLSYQDCVATRLQGDGSYPSHERQRVVQRSPLAGDDAWS